MASTRAFAAALVLAAALVAGCVGNTPLPPERAAYAGEWRGGALHLTITAWGSCDYERVTDHGRTLLTAPIRSFDGDSFVVGIWPARTTFKVTRPPHLEGGLWRMTVDGVELTRVDHQRTI
jgi:hypothetical protein